MEVIAFRVAVTIWELRRGDSPYGPPACGRILAQTRTDLTACVCRTLLESMLPLPSLLDEQLACMMFGSRFFVDVTAASTLKLQASQKF